MDWLEEKIEHTRMRIRNTRFCTAITAYILVAAAAAMFLSCLLYTSDAADE